MPAMPFIQATPSRSKIVSALIAATAAVFSAGGAPAQQTPAPSPNYMPNSSDELRTLITGCEDPSCMSYVYGVISGASLVSALADRPSPFCAPEIVTGTDIRDAIIATIDGTPQLQTLPAAFSILSTFAKNWPCLTPDDLAEIQDNGLKPVDPDILDALIADGGLGFSYGDPAETTKKLIVFHEQNCQYCRRFTAEAQTLAAAGWRIEFYPVAVVSEESGGYGSVEIALAQSNPEAARMLHEADNQSGVYNIESALRIAQRAGVATTTILDNVSKMDAAARLKKNTEIFYALGAEGTPAMILGYNLYSGFIGSKAIQDIYDTFDLNE